MKGKLIRDYLVVTFLVMLGSWGMILLLGLCNRKLSNTPWLYVLFLVGGLSPAIGSFIASKKVGKITGFKDWLRQIFTIKQSFKWYILVITLILSFLIPLCLVAGYTRKDPILMIIVMLPVMFIGGGMEETGWRFILQSELMKKTNYCLASLCVSVIWAFWHLPLFFIEGVGQYGTNFLYFFIQVIGLSFALGLIQEVTNSSWLCIVFHMLANSILNVFLVKQSFAGSMTATIIVVILSIGIHILTRKNSQTVV